MQCNAIQHNIPQYIIIYHNAICNSTKLDKSSQNDIKQHIIARGNIYQYKHNNTYNNT